VLVELASALVFAGRDGFDDSEGEPGSESFAGIAAQRIPEGECLMIDYRWDLVDSLRACTRGEWEPAIEPLAKWDRRLAENNNLHEWFETRLRLIAAHRLAGEDGKIERLAAPLRERANQSNDWLTLRRLARLLDPAEPCTPLALLAPVSIGPYASTQPQPAPAETPLGFNETPETEEPNEWQNTPLAEAIAAIYQRWSGTDPDDAPARTALLDETLSFDPQRVTHPRDAERLLYLAGAPGAADSGRGAAIWQWAEAIAAAFPDDAAVVGQLAWLGFSLREAAPELADRIALPDLDRLFRKTVRMDAGDADNFLRAGIFFHAQEDLGEAERCYARAFRLQRNNSHSALRLAEIYQQTERPRDALAALDMCLREGADHPAVAWEAAVAALSLDKYEDSLAYLNHFEEIAPGEPNTQYYRGVALLELERGHEALAALDEEERRAPGRVLHLNVIRACANLDLRRLEAARQCIQSILSKPLREADFLTLSGFAQLFARLWRRMAALPEGDPLVAQVDEFILASGMAPDELFEKHRQQEAKAKEVIYYRCLVRQPLSKDWPQSPGCLPGQESWREYLAEWGVLAADEDDAVRRVLAWQSRCHALPGEMEALDPGAEKFFDKPGVVWQGFRWNAAE
jgi:tetratricopeptide (TPR) repeat protein